MLSLSISASLTCLFILSPKFGLMRTLITLVFFSSLLSAPAFGQWTTTNLSEGKTSMSAATYGSKVYFGGGSTNTATTKKVELYDTLTGNWNTKQFSIPREFTAATAAGGKVFFAGGIDFFTFQHYSRVDIYDILTSSWTTAELSSPRFDVAAAAYGNKVFFAGGVNLATGVNSSTIDIYDVVTQDWTTASLSEAGAVRSVAVGSKVIFVGTSMMDIYDGSAGNWTAISLPAPRLFTGVAAAGNKVLIAGGMNFNNTATNRVDIYDLGTGNWDMANLSESRAFLNNAATACGKAFFAGGGIFNLNTNVWTAAKDKVDIYDPSTDAWTTDQLSDPVVNHVTIAIGNKILVAGGVNPATGEVFSHVDIYTCSGVSAIWEQEGSKPEISLYPNPSDGMVRVSLKGNFSGDYILTVSDIYGQPLQRRTLENLGVSGQTVDLSNLPAGVYLISLSDGADIFCSRLVKG